MDVYLPPLQYLYFLHHRFHGRMAQRQAPLVLLTDQTLPLCVAVVFGANAVTNFIIFLIIGPKAAKQKLAVCTVVPLS